MPTLLVIEVSPQLSASVSRALTAGFVDIWQEMYPDGEVVTRDLVSSDLAFINQAWVDGAFTPADTHSAASAAAMRVSDGFIDEIKSADHILIGTPMHNLSIPASLKAYIDNIVRVGSTVSAENVGLITGKKAAVIIASGGDFSPCAPSEQFNHAVPYLRAVLGFVGITDLQFVMAGPTRPIMMGERDMKEFTDCFRGDMAEIVQSWGSPGTED